MPEQPMDGPDLIGWLEKLQQRLQDVLDAPESADPQATLNELVAMSQRFLSLSRAFLELGMKASKAAESMLENRGKRDQAEPNQG